MAKGGYKNLAITQVSGTLDVDMNGDFIVVIEDKEGIHTFDLMEILATCKGRNIDLKLVEEEAI